MVLAIDKDAMVQMSLAQLSKLLALTEETEQYQRWYKEERDKALTIPALEKIIEHASNTIMHYGNYVDMTDDQLKEANQERPFYLRQAREHENNFREAIKEIKKEIKKVQV